MVDGEVSSVPGVSVGSGVPVLVVAPVPSGSPAPSVVASVMEPVVAPVVVPAS